MPAIFPVLEMFINIGRNCTFQENFVNNFRVPKLQTLKFPTEKEAMVMQISAAPSPSPSPNFHLGKSYVKKISVYFLTICTNFPCKIAKFELEVVGMGCRDRILLFFNKFENCFTLVNNNIYW